LAETKYTTITTAQARRNLAEILNRVAYGEERIIVTRHGRQIAGIVPINLIRRLMRMEEQERTEGMSAQDLLVEELKKALD
jgi:prevent-host-death family protein